jgi:hypothetical protein
LDIVAFLEPGIKALNFIDVDEATFSYCVLLLGTRIESKIRYFSTFIVKKKKRKKRRRRVFLNLSWLLGFLRKSRTICSKFIGIKALNFIDVDEATFSYSVLLLGTRIESKIRSFSTFIVKKKKRKKKKKMGISQPFVASRLLKKKSYYIFKIHAFVGSVRSDW